MTLEVHPNDLAEIATILARGYLRYRDSLRRGLQNSLASGTERSPHVPVVNETENGRETEKATGEEA
jgi:hypothetical protein